MIGAPGAGRVGAEIDHLGREADRMSAIRLPEGQPAGRRLRCLPPAILREAEETIEGSNILGECRDNSAVLLWKACREVSLWASVEEDRRDGLFTPDASTKRLAAIHEAGLDSRLEIPLTALTEVLSSPAVADAERIAGACSRVSEWCAERAALGTALAFAQAAALATPTVAGRARAVGELAIRSRRFHRAETWLRLALGLARRARDWQSYVEVFVDLGELHRLLKHRSRSERYYRAGAREARRHSYLQLRAAALHGLHLLSFERGDLEAAERYARAAARAYRRGHPRLLELMHTLAEVWIARGSYARALPVLQRLLPGRHAPLDRAHTLTLVAQAAIGCGEVRLYEEAWTRAWASLASRTPPARGEETVKVLAELARVAAKAGDWQRVALAAHRYVHSPAVAAADPQLWDEMRRLSADVAPMQSSAGVPRPLQSEALPRTGG